MFFKLLWMLCPSSKKITFRKGLLLDIDNEWHICHRIAKPIYFVAEGVFLPSKALYTYTINEKNTYSACIRRCSGCHGD